MRGWRRGGLTAGLALGVVTASLLLVSGSPPGWATPGLVLLIWGWAVFLAAALALALPERWIERAHASTRWRLVAAVLLVVFLAVETAMAWQGHRVFWRQEADRDVWLYIDTLQRTLRGEFLYWFSWHTLEPEPFLAHRWALQLALLVPLWVLWPDPRLLYLLQIGAYAAAAVMVYRLAEERLGRGMMASFILLAMLLAPTKDWTLFRHFAYAPLFPLLITLAVWAIHRGHPLGFAGAAGLMLLSREDAVFVAVPLALYAWWERGWRRLGLLTAGAAVVWTGLLFTVVMPWFNPAEAGRSQLEAYAWLGGSAGEMAWTVLTRPGRVLEHLWGAPLAGLGLTLGAFGGLPLAGGRALILLLGFAHALLHGGYAHTLLAQHSYPALTLSALVAIEGARRLGLTADRGLERPRLRAGLVFAVPVAALLLQGAFGYLPLSRHFTVRDFQSTSHSEALLEAMERIPRGGRVTATRHLLNHLIPGRPHTCAWESAEVRPEVTPGGLWCRDWTGPLDSEFILLASPKDSPDLRQLLRSKQWGVVFHGADVFLLRRGAPAVDNTALGALVLGTTRARDLPHWGEIESDPRAVTGRAVRVPRGVRGLAVYGWYRTLCPGSYVAELSARTDGGRAGEAGRLEVVSEAGTRLIAKRPISAPVGRGAYETLALAFELPEAREVEVRVHTTGRTALWLDELRLLPQERPWRLQDLLAERCESP